MKEDETKRGREWLFDEPDEQVLFAADDWKLAAVCDRRQQTRDDCLRAFRLLPSEAGESEYDECEAESRMLATNKRGRHQPRKAKKAQQAQQLSVGTRKVGGLARPCHARRIQAQRCAICAHGCRAKRCYISIGDSTALRSVCPAKHIGAGAFTCGTSVTSRRLLARSRWSLLSSAVRCVLGSRV